MVDITDAYADPPEEVSTLSPEKYPNAHFVRLYALASLNAYLAKRKARAALPLLLAIQRRIDVLKKRRVPLSSKVWKDVGNPSKNERVTMLAHLHRMPDLVMLHEDRHPMFRYRVEKGPAWHQIDKAGKNGRGLEEDDEEEDI